MKPVTFFAAVGALFLTLATAIPGRAETFVGSNIDSRVLVGLKASPEGVQAFLPDGWTIVPFPSGPMKGADALLAFIDGWLEMGPDGKPLTPPSRRAVALLGLGKQADGGAVRMYVLRVFTTSTEGDPYGAAVEAAIDREYALGGPAEGARQSSDLWRAAPETGGGIELSLSYTSGKRAWLPGELFPHSATDPDFSRIYRYEQMVDVVMSQALGKPMTGTFRLEVSVPELARIFDGSQEVVAVMDVPVYLRKVYLP